MGRKKEPLQRSLTVLYEEEEPALTKLNLSEPSSDFWWRPETTVLASTSSNQEGKPFIPPLFKNTEFSNKCWIEQVAPCTFCFDTYGPAESAQEAAHQAFCIALISAASIVNQTKIAAAVNNSSASYSFSSILCT